MARINVEDSLFSDTRFFELAIKLGSHELAMGAMIYAYKLAQKFWVPNKYPIPADQFRLSKIRKEIIEVGLAEVVEDGAIYIKGSENQFAWLIQRSKAGRNNKGKKAKRKRTELNGSERLESSSSYSSSYSDSNSNSILDSEGGADAPRPRSSNEFNKITWDAYKNAYFDRYKTEPVRNATVNGQIANLVRRLGKEAPEVIRFYLDQSRAFYIQSCHPVGLCLKDAEALRTQWASNKHMLPTQARKIEQRASNSDAWDRAEEYLKQRREGIVE